MGSNAVLINDKNPTGPSALEGRRRWLNRAGCKDVVPVTLLVFVLFERSEYHPDPQFDLMPSPVNTCVGVGKTEQFAEQTVEVGFYPFGFGRRGEWHVNEYPKLGVVC